tara:strand:- start:349 stop:1008 length:660 start_codon:yes stop_codon:yes gene_type:complete
MHSTIENLIKIKDQINKTLLELNKNKIPKIIAVSKTFPIEKILPLIEYGHKDFGENKVQECADKWRDVKLENKEIDLHLIGKLQRNKVKLAVEMFDYIHSVDNEKLAKKISEEAVKIKKIMKIFIQVNIGNENQKSGIDVEDLFKFYEYCKKLNLNVVGLMCIPPLNQDPQKFFIKMESLKQELNLEGLSMGMSADYLEAVKYSSSYVRIGSNIFGNRN